MRKQSLTVGQAAVPVSKIESILEALTEVAGRLEEITVGVQRIQLSGHLASPAEDADARIGQALTDNVCVGDESFTVAEIADAVAAALSLDGGRPVPEPLIRAALPKLMHQTVGARLSCSIRRNGRFTRGWRRIAAKG